MQQRIGKSTTYIKQMPLCKKLMGEDQSTFREDNERSKQHSEHHNAMGQRTISQQSNKKNMEIIGRLRNMIPLERT